MKKFKMRIRRLSIIGLGLALSGCATPITSLKPVDKNVATLHLSESFSYSAKSSTHLWGSQLLAGEYRPVGKDARGTFYMGPESCYSQRVLKPGPFAPDSSRNSIILADCALYLPGDPAAPVKVLIVTGSLRNIPLDNPDAPAADIQKQLDTAMADVSVPLTIAQNAVGNTVQAGIGAGLAWGIIGAMTAVEPGQLDDALIQPASGELRAALQRETADATPAGTKDGLQ